jgi:thioredoxin reductase
MDDVIIIGGNFAGLAGALQLGRARRKVILLDTGLPESKARGYKPGRFSFNIKGGRIIAEGPPEAIAEAAISAQAVSETDFGARLGQTGDRSNDTEASQTSAES